MTLALQRRPESLWSYPSAVGYLIQFLPHLRHKLVVLLQIGPTAPG
jgi:hypothetical protein